MDLRVLRYFLAVARLESFTKAAEFLHMSQPPLSREMKALEEELGKQLFIRSSRGIRLTEEGVILRHRAAEMISLMDKTVTEITTNNAEISGWVCLGSSETQSMRCIAKILKDMLDDYPGIRLHLYSGNAQAIYDQLDRGMLDFGLVMEPVNLSQYDYVRLPFTEKWGVLMRTDDPLARKESIQPEDLFGVPLFCSSQCLVENELDGWAGQGARHLNIIGEYNLLYNASQLVVAGAGCAVCFDGIIPIGSDSPLTFRPLFPVLESNMVLVWKKYHVFSRQSEKLIELVRNRLLPAT